MAQAQHNSVNGRYPLSVSKKHIICSEILAVTSAMRKNSRWASLAAQYATTSKDDALAASLGLRRTGTAADHASGGARREVQLLAGFLELKREVQSIPNIDDLPLTALFAPFFALIRSPLSTGPITATALSSLHTFFLSGLVSPDRAGLDIALADLSNAVSHCKFEASDASGDEVVLYRIMSIIEECMCGAVGDRLGDVEVCEMLETVLTTCCQMRLSEILRRSAESTMHAVVRRMFYRLRSLDVDEEEKKLLRVAADASETELKMNVQSSNDATSVELSQEVSTSERASSVGDAISAVQDPIAAQDFTVTLVRSDYGLPSVVELLRVLINILDPNDRLHTDSTRLTALRVLNTAFEVAGTEISTYPSLMGLIQDHSCKFLFQLARADNPAILHMALRVIATMFETMRGGLKLQQELFLAFTVDRLAPTVASKAQLMLLNHQRNGLASPKPGTPVQPSASPTPPAVEGDKETAVPSRPAVTPAKGETRELMLETLNHIARHPSFMVDLYVNYDCDVNCEDLFEKLLDFLTKGVYSVPTAGIRELPQQPSQMLCLDLVLEFVQHMLGRSEGEAEPWKDDYPHPEVLQSSKSRKRLVQTGAARFNTKPKVGLSFLEENGLIYSDLSEGISRAQSLARFLKGCTRLDKRLLGDFISRAENIDVLKAFISLFDFVNKPIQDAMRELLEAFRLPGESQQIARITETFAEIYFASKPADIKAQDAVYVLAYSVIMLNTDLHNPQIRRRMTLEDYQRNLRGVNDGSDFSLEFIRSIYESIRKSEIIMPEEHTGQAGFEYAWKELLARSRQSGPFRSCNSAFFDKAMFSLVWKPVVSAIAYAFTTFDDDYTVQRAITGFRECATLAGRFDLPEVFDFIVVSLSQSTSLVPDSLITRVPHYPMVKVEDQDVTVSNLSVKFGTNFKGQLATVVLFAIVNGNGNAVREGWTHIFEIYQNLFLHTLLPPSVLQLEDFLGGSTAIPLQGTQPTPKPVGRGDGGLLSALSSYLMTPYGSSETNIPEATDSEIENTLCTIDCINACRLDELYGQLTTLDADALVAAVRALEALAHERTVARLQQESDDLAATNSRKGGRQSLSYDPASVYLLETMISTAMRTSQYIDEVWPVVYEHLSSLLSFASHYSILLIERAIVGLWRLCQVLAGKPSMRDQIYLSLDLLRSLPPAIVNSVGEQVVAGLVSLVKTHREVIRSQTEWALVFALIRNTLSQAEASRQSFELLLSLACEGPDQCVHADNFVGLVNLLEEYVTAAGHAVEASGQNYRRTSAQPAQDVVVQRGRRAIDILFDLRSFIPEILKSSSLPPSQGWQQFALPLISVFGRQSTNACREVRHLALIHLQRLLLGQHVITDDGGQAQAEIIFNRVVFPLLDDLLRPQVIQRDPRGMPETRLRASALLCKVFMHFETLDAAKQADIRVLWIQVLDLLDRLMNLDKRDQLHEAVPESLKNVILVMNTTDLLVPPSPEDRRTVKQKALWEATHERIGRFLPGFLDDVLPTPQVMERPPHAASQQTSPISPTQ